MSIILSEIVSHNPIKKIETKFKELLNDKLQTISNIIFMYCEESFAVNPVFEENEKYLRTILSETRSNILGSLGKLSSEDKYIYLLKINDWVIELSSRKDEILDDGWGNIVHKNTQALDSFYSNRRIIKDGLYPVYVELLDELTVFIKDLLDNFRKGLLTDQSPKEVAEIIIKHKPQFVLSEGLKLQSIKGKDKTAALDKYQTALLFHYLKEKEAIIDLVDKDLAHVLSRLTPHSEQNLRTEGLYSIKFIKGDHPDYRNKTFTEPNRNLTQVRVLLQNIIDDIDSQIALNIEKK